MKETEAGPGIARERDTHYVASRGSCCVKVLDTELNPLADFGDLVATLKRRFNRECNRLLCSMAL